jgi:hypothetical protein
LQLKTDVLLQGNWSKDIASLYRTQQGHLSLLAFHLAMHVLFARDGRGQRWHLLDAHNQRSEIDGRMLCCVVV